MTISGLYVLFAALVVLGMEFNDALKTMSPPAPLLKGTRLPLTLPPPMRSNVPGTWAYDTMSRRVLSDIIPRIIEDNKDELTRPSSPLRAECLLQLNDLKASLECGKTGYLRGITDSGSDVDEWGAILATVPEEQRNWLDAPWVISEFYLYRRITEAFRFFETGYDMFVNQKVNGLMEALPSINEIATRLPDVLTSDRALLKDALEIGIQTSLWGNKMDLSLWPAQQKSSEVTSVTATSQRGSSDVGEAGKISFGAALAAGRKYILDDHISAAVDILAALYPEDSSQHSFVREIGIVVDNAGYELVSDMLLGHFLVKLGVATTVTFHTKGHPTFVSDATTSDCLETLDFLANSPFPATSDLAREMISHVSNGQFKFESDLFWCQPTSFWDMPPHIQEKIKDSKMIFVKGDANYRRLLGEREWPMDTAAADILSYWPVPVCALRTFKAEIGCGISSEKQVEAQAADSKWKVSGKWAVVQVGGPGL